MTNHVIPAEAVEAAAKALAIQAWGQWEYVPNELRKAFIRDAKITLEAAAPHMLAAAWDEGYMCSYDQERGGHGVGPVPVPEYLADDLAHWNPYRTPDAR